MRRLRIVVYIDVYQEILHIAPHAPKTNLNQTNWGYWRSIREGQVQS